ncbi:PhzF family phenazine biosynthesis protein [Tundrisphaera lichenicola]|uniref:PhzF family phenazine biosynthesis protein n=1 Tax=Tundrisphaera lichenicola TaxID=2029860 RepID=UPI003EB831C4
MPQRIVQVDAFTDRPFAGNPAAVCVLPGPVDPAWMQAVAAEMNLSETAFLVPEEGGFHLRWFTPTVEVDLCGHATLASAHVLWEDGHLAPGASAQFRTRSGLLIATREGDRITLDFPATPVERDAEPGPIAEALGVPVVAAGMTRFDVLAEVESEAVVRSMKPNFGLLEAIPARGLIVTARADSPGFDFVSRFFAPSVGVREDPVTGSAHCALAPYWLGKLGRAEMVAYQASSRGGVVRVRIEGDRVKLGGQAVTVLRGELVGEASEVEIPS